jgi:hypothetical protein
MFQYILGTLFIGSCLGVGVTLGILKFKQKKEKRKAAELLGYETQNKLNKEVKNGRTKIWDKLKRREQKTPTSIGLPTNTPIPEKERRNELPDFSKMVSN